MATILDAGVRQAVEETIRTSQVPGIVVTAARDGQPAEYLVVGQDAAGRTLGEESLFPVASVTKLATALAELRLADDGALALDDPLARYVPDAAAAQPAVTLRELLSHTAGLPYELSEAAAPPTLDLNWRGLAKACLETPLAWQPGSHVEYSNIGYGLLAIVVERLTDQDFPSALASLVLEPLGAEAYLGVEPPRPPVQLADVRGRNCGTPLEPFNSAWWRSLGLPWAGMLATATGALALVQAFRGDPAGFLHPETLAEATRNQVGSLGCKLFGRIPWPQCPWGLGPELRDAKSPHWAPPEAHPESFGHAGQSGCVVWADPSAGIAWAILGARTADSGWLMRRGSVIGGMILAAARSAEVNDGERGSI